MTDPAEIYLSPPCCSDMVGEGRLWCENDEWPEGDCGTPEEHRPATRYVRADLAHADLMSTERVIMVRESEWRQMRVALEHFVTYGCPVCGGDCASANPPVDGCPMRAAHAALSHPTPLAGGDDG